MGSSSKHSRKDTTTYVSKQQIQHQEWDAWEEENVVEEDEVIPEDVTPELIAESQNVDKRVPTIFDHARMEATLRYSLSNLSRNTEEYAYHLEQSTSFMENQIVWESRQQDIPRTIPKTLIFYGPQRNPNEPPRPLYNKDLFFLKYGNTEEKKYILSLHKIHVEEFPELDLEEKLNRWVRKFKTFNEDARLSIQHWKDSWHKRVYNQNQKRVGKNPKDYYSNHRITEVVRIVTDQPHGLDFMEQILVMRANDKPDSFSEADFKYLNKNDIEDLYYLCRSKEIDNRKVKLMNSLITFIRSCVIWERVHDFQLGIESYQMKVNLTAPTLTFPGIEEHAPYTIVDEPQMGLIYLNSKDEKRVMYLEEIVKFCDATLEKVLNEVKLRMFESKFLKKPPLLGELDQDIMKAYEREISKRLSHRQQMRRWESFVNGRPILPTMKRLILESHVVKSNLMKMCSLVFRHWDWTSNGAWCSKGTRIILGWNHNEVHSADVTCGIALCLIKVIVNNVLVVFWEISMTIIEFLVVYGEFNWVVDIAMREFKDCVNNIEVLDVQNTGLHFTWNQKPKGTDGILKKLDRVMANMTFVNDFAGSHAIFKPYRNSDHSPSVLCIPTATKVKPKPFKFFNVLIKHDRFKEVVNEAWNYHVSGFYMFRTVKKLKNLKKPLRKLMIDKGNLHANVERIRGELDTIQTQLDTDPFNIRLREIEAANVVAFNQAVLDEEMFLKQKAKISWLKDGGFYSGYFTVVPDAFVAHYEAFLGQTGYTNGFDGSNLFSNCLDEQGAAHMVRMVTDSEIKEAMFSMGDEKSPGPDGFSAAFFKQAWHIVGVDVINAIREFFTNGKLLKELNHTIIALIPKVNAPSRINDYRPISCCNVLYKCISKIIANRIKHCLTNLVSPNQSAFIPGRSIADNILLTQELMHNYHLDRGPPRCAFKVDIQKAYDTVD
ncbi:hypothetical protein Tco_0823189 [Tanacetum coccineum]|uniref:Reverse transcriptase domain-containing protein n=1 Tax=Tanacetum coccineum TaxID=301880 RepID=A0ABQ5AH80_9ASTR